MALKNNDFSTSFLVYEHLSLREPGEKVDFIRVAIFCIFFLWHNCNFRTRCDHAAESGAAKNCLFSLLTAVPSLHRSDQLGSFAFSLPTSIS